MLLGAHVSTAGGLDRAFAAAEREGAGALQVFTKVSAQWREPTLARGQVEAFRAAHRAFGGAPLIAHDSYLVNLCADKEELLARSRAALLAEVERCDALGVDFIAFHPGSAGTLPREAALARVGESLSEVLAQTRGARTRLCLENTAGQGSAVGWSLEEIATIVNATDDPARVGVCLDTQHLFAAGYDLRDDAGYDAFFREVEARLGVERVCCFHLNDSKRALGERVDRHEEIGKGHIGAGAFHRLVNDPRFARVAGVLELPPEVVGDNLARLRAMVGAEPPAPTPPPVAPPPAARKPRKPRK